MMRRFAQITLLTGTLLVGLVPLAMAGTGGQPPVSTGVVAQVTAVDPKTDMATLQTEAGEVFTCRRTKPGTSAVKWNVTGSMKVYTLSSRIVSRGTDLRCRQAPPGRAGALLTPPASPAH